MAEFGTIVEDQPEPVELETTAKQPKQEFGTVVEQPA
jgi:hypothetical protein